MTRVLIADDDPDIRELVAFKLERHDMVVETAADGEIALQVARETRPDLVLLDIMMPNHDGLDVLRILRADPSFAQVPIILLTARSREFDVEQGFTMGANDYIIKPFSPRELLSRVNALLARPVG